MRFLESLADAIVNRSVDELIGALLIAGAAGVVVAGLYALGRRTSSPSPTFVGGLGLAAGALCMALAAGYIEYAENARLLGSASNQAAPPTWPPGGPVRVPPPPPGSFFGPGWSSSFHVVLAADLNHDGRLTPDEAAQMVRNADTDGDGAVTFRDIDRVILSRFRPRLQPSDFADTLAGPNDRERGGGSPETGVP
jgi:hypothetical protein